MMARNGDEVAGRSHRMAEKIADPAAREFFENLPDELLPPEDETSPRARILNAARDLFAEKGFNGASTREIAVRADVNQAMINYYYGSKEILYERAVTSQLFSMFESLAQSHTAGVDPRDFIFSFPVHLIDVLRRNESWIRLMRREIAEGGENIKRVIQKLDRHGPRGLLQVLRSYYERGVDAGYLRDLPIESVAQFLITLSYGTLMMDPFFSEVTGSSILDDEVWEERKETFRKILTNGLASREAQ